MTKTETVPIKKLKQHPDNPRQGDIGAIAVSIQENGWYGVIVAQKSTGHVLAGNHRLRAAKKLGMTELPVYWVDVDDTQARKILLADNRTNDLAAYDDGTLAEILAELATTDDLLGTGYDGTDLDTMLEDLEYATGADLDLSGISVDTSVPARSATEQQEFYEAAGIRSIILPYTTGQHAAVAAALIAHRESLKVETNSEVIAALLGL